MLRTLCILLIVTGVACAQAFDQRMRTLTLSPRGTGAGQTGQACFEELRANGTNTACLKAPDSLSATIGWSLPSSDGTNGQVLTTNGAGALSWSSGGGSGTTITVNGSPLAATSADFDDSTPAAPANKYNVKWQKDALTPTNISAYVDPTLFVTPTWGSGSTLTWTFDDGVNDLVLAFSSGASGQGIMAVQGQINSRNIYPDTDAAYQLGQLPSLRYASAAINAIDLGKASATVGVLNIYHSAVGGTATIRGGNVTASGSDIEFVLPTSAAIYPSADNAFNNGLATRQWGNTYSARFTASTDPASGNELTRRSYNDSTYGRLAVANTWTAGQTFNAALAINATATGRSWFFAANNTYAIGDAVNTAIEINSNIFKAGQTGTTLGQLWLRDELGGTTFIMRGVGGAADIDGNLIPKTDLNHAIGTAGRRFSDLRVNTATFSGAVTFSSTIAVTGASTFTGGTTHNGGLQTGSSANSTLYIGGSGNFYTRTFSGGDVSCGGVTDGWMGVRTDTNELQVCIGGVVKKVALA